MKNKVNQEEWALSKNLQEKVLKAMLCMTRQCWEQGMAAQCLLEIERKAELELMVYDTVLRQSDDGRLCNVENTPAVTDSAFCIPAVMEWADKNDCKEYKEAAERNITFFLNEAERGNDGTLYHMIHTKEVWADSAAFLPYALAKAGYVEEAFKQMKGICERLYDKETGLFFHMWDDGKNEYIRALPWGIGNGWILTGMLRLYLEVPEAYEEEKKELLYNIFKLLDTVLFYETDDHRFYDILNDNQSFKESEISAMVAYTIYRGIHEGILSEKYRKRADDIRMALHERVSGAGLVLCAASSPDFVKSGTSVECQAHFLMMEYWAEK